MIKKIFYKQIVISLATICLSFAGHSQKTFSDLRTDLDKETSAKEKADICFTISVLYSNRLKIDSAIFFANKIKEFSGQNGYKIGFGKHYFALGLALFYRSRNEEAEENTLKAIEIFTHQKDILLLGRAYMQAGQIQYRFNLGLSRKNYWTAINCFLSCGNKTGCFRGYYLLARTYHKSSEIDSVAFYYVKALAIAEEEKNGQQIYDAACELGKSFLNLGDFKKAFIYLDYGLKNRMPSSDKIMVRVFLRDYATCLILMHDFARADSAIKEFELMNVKLGDAWGKISLNKIRGVLEYERKNYSQALNYLEQAYSKRDELNTFDREIKEIGFLLGKTEYETYDYDGAIIHLRFVAQWSHEWGELTDEMDADLLISRSFEKKGMPDSALHYFQSYSLLKDSILSVQKQKMIIEVATRYETEKKEQQIQLLQREKELDAYQLKSKMDEIEKQNLADAQKSQQLALLSQENEIGRLEASEKSLAFDNQQKEMIKKQNELTLLAKENELQAAIAAKEGQRKNFAYIAIMAVLLFSAYVFYRYTQNKKLSSQLGASLINLRQAQEQLIKTEKEKEGDKIRVRISRDIHDEVGATLSGVALFSEIAREKIQQHKESDAQTYLDHITTNSKEMIEKMSDIVWTINPLNDSFERLISKLQSYAVNLCAGKNIRLHFAIEDTVRLYSPSMQVRKNIYMLMKEAINNAVKYSDGKNIFISLLKKEAAIVIEIKDDGKGFDKNKNHAGNGLNNMQARATDLDANFTIDSKQGEGTHIRLQFNFHPAGGHREAV